MASEMNLEGEGVFLGAGTCIRKPPKLLGEGVAPEGGQGLCSTVATLRKDTVEVR